MHNTVLVTGGSGFIGTTKRPQWPMSPGVGRIPANSYFLFAPIKVRDCHGGPGRAIVLH
jgi:hypothetical protein